MGSYHNLDNEEVVFIYIMNKKFIDQYNMIFEAGGVETIADISPAAYVVSFKALDEQDLLNMTSDPHYLYCLSINEKLQPIVELIQEELPELYDKVQKSFDIKSS